MVGFEDIVTVDRKGAVSEFATNLFDARFERELERMSTFKFAAIVLEFDWEAMNIWPKGSGIPFAKQQYMKITSHILIAKFWSLKLAYPHVDFMFAGNYGKEAVSSLFKRVRDKYGRKAIISS
jgi:hypothetical protein